MGFAKTLGEAVLERLKKKPHLAGVLVLVKGDEYGIFGVDADGLENFWLNDTDEGEGT